MKNLRIYAIIFISSLIIFSCSDISENDTISNSNLINKKWKLVELLGNDIQLNGDSYIYITFNSGNQFSGFSGCNYISGKYELREGNKIRFFEIVTTEMGCNNLDLESEFTNTLIKADNYTFAENVLYLNKARTDSFARFEIVIE